MLSLAAFRYRNVLAAAGGPVERLEMSDTWVVGQRQFLANAYLKKDLARNKEGGSLYSQAHGSGTAASPHGGPVHGHFGGDGALGALAAPGR